MPLPTRSDVHVDGVLSNLSLMYRNADYIGETILPKVLVGKASDKYYTFDQSDFFRNEAGRRAPATEGPVGGYRLSTDSYSTEQRAMTSYVADEERDNADEGLNLDVQAVEYCADKVRMSLEVDAAATLFVTGGYASGHSETLTGTNQWSDPTSTPIEAVDVAADLIGSKIAKRPNTLILGVDSFRLLKNHPDIAEVLKYTQAAIITEQLLASVFNVERVLVARGIKDTAGEGATDSFAYIWTADSAALLYVAPSPGLRTLSYGYTFVWSGYDFITERFRNSVTKADGFRTIAQWDMKVSANTAGYLWVDTKA